MKNRQIRELLERLNEHCSQAIEEAAAFAATRSHYEVTIEHVLIKLLEQGGGDLDRILRHFDVDLDAFWQGLLTNLGRLRANNPGKPAFSPLLFDWLERAWLAASLHYDLEGLRSLPLLDALLEISPMLPGEGWRELERVDTDILHARAAGIVAGSVEGDLHAAAPVGTPTGQPSSPAARPASGGDSALARFTEDIVAKAANGEIDPVLGRDEEVRLMIDILSRRRKNNPILVGDPGVGKTALVEGLALRIAQGTVPDDLKPVHIHTLDLGLLQAGAGVKGEFEKRLKQVIDEVRSAPQPIILFIDEAHTLIGAGGEAGMSDAANLLKPALARGELRTIAATTWSEYKKYFERDAALERRFQMVKVEEPSEENAIVMLNGLKVHYQMHHNILITDSAIEAAVRLSSRYINGRQLPDKAIDLLDTAAARIRMGQAARPAELEKAESRLEYLERRLAHLEAEQRSGIAVDDKLWQRLEADRDETRARLERLDARWRQESELVAAIHDKRHSLQQADDSEAADVVALRNASDDLREELSNLQGDQPLVQAEVNAAAVAEVIADWTGVPVGKMLKDDIETLMQLEERLAERVVGQEHALAAIARTVRSARAGLRNPDAPLGVFLLAGPSGVGKTETARALADELLGDERYLITINMSEYQEAHTVSQLKGSPPGYVGYGEGGVLTEAVRQRPWSIVLLDEVEKAHPDVMNLFYQVFDRGFMRDGEGREIDFRNTLILMTSNLGTETIQRLATPPAKEEESAADWQPPTLGELREAIHADLRQHFAPALLGRMQVIPYLPLAGDALQVIAALKLDAVGQRLQAAHDITFRCQPEVLAHLADQGMHPDTGARHINALVDQQLLPEMSRSLLQFLREGDLPDILTLEIDTEGQLSFVFADRLDEAAAQEATA